MIRRAVKKDLDAICEIYSDIHTMEESGSVVIGWDRNIYPTRATAEAALERGDIFVEEADGQIVGTGIINQVQVDTYAKANWSYEAPDDQVMVLHTLIISPKAAGKGFGRQFVRFYEEYALKNGCPVLRIDTNARNTTARKMYRKLGYREADIISCVFNGIEGVQLVHLEKRLEE